MCGVFGIVANGGVSQEIFDALIMLQHRGQDAAGISTINGSHINIKKDNGLVRDALSARDIASLQGNVGIGHVRYPTAGCSSPDEAQPFYVNSPYGIVLAHNGTITNSKKLIEEIFNNDLRHLNTSSDSEVLINILAHELFEIQRGSDHILSPEKIFRSIKKVFERCKGGFAVVSMILGYGMIAFRDPHGIRPLCYGQRKTDEGIEYAVSSESVALDALGFELIGDVPAGGMLFIPFSKDKIYTNFDTNKSKVNPCLLEYIYLARPDSIMDGVSVYKARLRMGRLLAKTVLKTLKKEDIDVVIPIPETGRPVAIDLAHELNSKYREGFIKNRYIGRTFIMPQQRVRRKSVRQKLNTTPLEFKDKNVLLVDDSIIRGTTSKQIIKMARKAGAKKVYFASASPKFLFPNVYGIDLPNRKDLIAHDSNDEKIAKEIGADKVFYQSIENLEKSIQFGNNIIESFENSCFTGKYITNDISEDYLKEIESKRGNTTTSINQEKSQMLLL
jgi:amidophosphoribosyltransferase